MSTPTIRPTGTIPGKPRIFMHPVSERVGAVTITGIQVAHDETRRRAARQEHHKHLDDGELRLAHLGDLGHLLDEATVKKMGHVDVLLIPVGGYFTIDSPGRGRVVDALAPSIVMPMHYKTPKIDFPIASADAFLRNAKDGTT